MVRVVKELKVLLINSSDSKGGAARAAYRLHQGFQLIEVDSQMLVQVKNTSDRLIIGSPAQSGIGKARTGLKLTLDRLPLKLYPNGGKSNYSLHWLPDKTDSQVAQLAPDIINLHWVSAGYLKIETVAKFKQPIVWTLHDMWAFTGGCHYNQECERYIDNCGSCPQLGSKRDGDLSRWVWNRKNKAWKNLNLTVVTPSVWLAKCAQESSLFGGCRVEVIPNSVDTDVYRPIDKKVARDLLKLPQDKQLILFLSLKATSDKRKGFHFLQPALQKLSQAGWKDKLELMVVGASRPEEPPEFGFESHYLGTLNDDLTLTLAYSAADVFIVTSVQDNLPNTVMEAISCGTPCVAFNIGGMPDMIEHQLNGYLAQPYQIDDLAQGIVWTLENEQRYQKLADYARHKAETEFGLKTQGSRYLSLFKEILTNSDR
ncbi:Glycosyl transferase, group 1 [Hyella patelloides LEGE 07179]|uniref:Glycosyl transferase, group 1 n=1 Tax=Hyella patelloides LEGE 07179 TaxID=945734 RepID=A0A563VS57_9CYAN|nr:Glycosyl transferase, group 1 [Hyella patelloides LEGE 07179]